MVSRVVLGVAAGSVALAGQVLSGAAAAQPAPAVAPGPSAAPAEASWREPAAAMRARLGEMLAEMERRLAEMRAQAAGAPAGGELGELMAARRRVEALEMRVRELRAMREAVAWMGTVAREVEGLERPRAAAPTVAAGQGGAAAGGAPAPGAVRRPPLGWQAIAIRGAGDALVAELWSELGGRVVARVGDRLPDGGEVAGIDAGGVTLRGGGGTERLGLVDMAHVVLRLGQLGDGRIAVLPAGLGPAWPGWPGAWPGAMVPVAPGMPVQPGAMAPVAPRPPGGPPAPPPSPAAAPTPARN